MLYASMVKSFDGGEPITKDTARKRKCMTSTPLFNPALRDELLRMRAEDEHLREELASDGSLYEGYHPRMADVHRRNCARLLEIIKEHGWTGKSLVGEDGAKAAWIIAQHAISDPALKRHCLTLIEEAVRKGEAPAWQMAYLIDRIRVFEGRKQVYGLQFDWDEAGEMSPREIEDIDNVDNRRRTVGLPPLAESVRRQREEVAQSNEFPPTDWHARQREMQEWARLVGWRK